MPGDPAFFGLRSNRDDRTQATLVEFDNAEKKGEKINAAGRRHAEPTARLPEFIEQSLATLFMPQMGYMRLQNCRSNASHESRYF